MSQPVIDAHHHIWHRDDVPWLASEPRPRIFGDYEPIRRDYLVDEYKTDNSAFNVVKSIYMQANWAPERALDEARWVDSVGAANGMPNGIIAFADLRSPTLGDLLRDYAEIKRVCGIRHQIHWHKNPNFAYVQVPDLFNDATWQEGLRRVTAAGYPFDLQLFPSQLEPAAPFVRKFEDTTFILNHAGMLDARDDATVATWKRGLTELSRCPNLYVKLTGLGTFDRKSSVELLRPIVDTVLELFGAERCIFGSNFPVEKMWTTYAELCEHLVEAIGPITDKQRSSIFYDNAVTVYRIS